MSGPAGQALVGHNSRGEVVVDFQVALNWIAFTPAEAEVFAKAMLARVALLRAGASGSPDPTPSVQSTSLAVLTSRREGFEEVIRLIDHVRNDPGVPLDDELDAFRRLADRRRLAAATEEERMQDSAGAEAKTA